MEGIRTADLEGDPPPLICFVYTITEGCGGPDPPPPPHPPRSPPPPPPPSQGDLEGGKFPAPPAPWNKVADHYRHPSIHMGLEVAHLHQPGNFSFTGTLRRRMRRGRASTEKLVFSGDGGTLSGNRTPTLLECIRACHGAYRAEGGSGVA